MLLIRLLFSLVLPPLAVVDKGCVVLLVVTLLTIAGWFPGVIAALLVTAIEHDRRKPRYVMVGGGEDKLKRKRAPSIFIDAPDGVPLEVVDPDQREDRDADDAIRRLSR